MSDIKTLVADEIIRMVNDGQEREAQQLLWELSGYALQTLAETRRQPKFLHGLLRIMPTCWSALHNLSSLQWRLQRWQLARKIGERACLAAPAEQHESHSLVGNICFALRDFDAAEAYYRVSLQRLDLPMTRFNLGTLLITKDFFNAEGWNLYRSRLEAFEPSRVMLARWPGVPYWDGTQKIRGKTLVVVNEQGYGDWIQFCRWLPMVRKLGARIVVEVQEALKGLVGPEFADEVHTRPAMYTSETPAPQGDYVICVADLPGVFRRMPPWQPYMTAPDLPSLGFEDQFRIGFVYSGRPEHPHDKLRSCPLRYFRPLTKVPGTKWFLFQPEHRPDLMGGSGGMDYVDLSSQLTDFQTTASYLKQMDLVIAVDSCVGVLAAALGVPNWDLLPYVSDWRWGTATERTHWCPNTRLFKQTKHLGWRNQFKAVREALIAHLARRDHGQGDTGDPQEQRAGGPGRNAARRRRLYEKQRQT